ncbi:MAG: prephenate dehydratase [Dehalococcoidia bacterium]|nr:prephenate dehydratase [Dehalococcoidia bacterium]
MRLAHLGPRGTYTEAAAIAHDPRAELVPSASVAAAIAAVRAGQADAAVCAIENSIEGGVTETLDQLLQEDFALRIAAEVVLPIRHALVGPEGLELRTARVVYSHPQALAQCRRRLNELAPGARPVAALSTAAAIESALQEQGALAVGNALAADLYGATVYEDDIADAPGNETRFVVVGHTDAAPTGDDKTSIAFTTHHDRPGSLVEVLRAFSERGINLTHIESRPTRRQLGTYVFLLDVQGHRGEPALSEALAQIERETLWLRVFGSYPRWQGPRLTPPVED